MESINIKNESQRTLCLNNDEARWISFDTEDLNFYGRLKVLYQSLDVKQKEYEAKAKEVRGIEGNDANGVSLAALALVDIQSEFAKYVTEGLDAIFGEGTCYRLFGNNFNPVSYSELIKGILTRVSRDREKKLQEVLKKKPGKKVMS